MAVDIRFGGEYLILAVDCHGKGKCCVIAGRNLSGHSLGLRPFRWNSLHHRVWLRTGSHGLSLDSPMQIEFGGKTRKRNWVVNLAVKVGGRFGCGFGGVGAGFGDGVGCGVGAGDGTGVGEGVGDSVGST